MSPVRRRVPLKVGHFISQLREGYVPATRALYTVGVSGYELKTSVQILDNE